MIITTFGFAPESPSTPGTPVTPTRWLPLVKETLDLNKVPKQGQGLRTGMQGDLASRRAYVARSTNGDLQFEAQSIGMGLLWQMLAGTAASTLVSGTTYQQTATLGTGKQTWTGQVGTTRGDTVTVDPYTFTGLQCSSFQLDFANADILNITASVLGMDMLTATALTSPTYGSDGRLFTFAGATLSTGTLTAGSTTTLASATTPLAAIRSGTLKVDRGMPGAPFNANGTGLPSAQAPGKPTITGTLVAEYQDQTFVTPLVSDSSMVLLLNWVTTFSLSAGVETLQVVLPAVFVESEKPKSNGPDLILQNVAFTAEQPASGAIMTIYQRTSDTAL